MLKTKIVSSLVKARLEDEIDCFEQIKEISALRGERLSLQLLCYYEFTNEKSYSEMSRNRTLAKISSSGELSEYISVRSVENVPVSRPTLADSDGDDDYISKKVGLFPDPLLPLHYDNTICLSPTLLYSLWIEINIPKDFKAGLTNLSLTIDNGHESERAEVKIEVIGCTLPDDNIYFTQWFHCDSLANYYGVKVWSERHWEIIENFARVAAKNGINMLLTPVFTPPLDTAVGGERTTCQLVTVRKKNEEYCFDFSLLDRWCNMCIRTGIEYFEISHFFTQWGAYHAPKIMITEGEKERKLFGWETDASDEEYIKFLRAFIVALLSHMKARGLDKNCFFHISDEPGAAHIESYKAAKASIADLLDGYVIMDALSNYDFWRMGIVDAPIPASNHISPFIDGGVQNLWTYYCCGQTKRVSNRFISMPSRRNRSIGFQLYKYDIVGFLHWGYNFYSNCNSVNSINPFLQLDGDGWVPPGDAFSVYPAQNGEALESLRIIVFHEALQDIKAMKLAERFVGKERIVNLIDEKIGEPVTFDVCAKSDSALLSLRAEINKIIKENIM
ncbi:MAG: DUF4091 domain-containing protein [Clostridia bacterium]|nr:DUF4091 domain-containing protein [Clostridia bacterium]